MLNHLAIIMDGNRRWADNNNKSHKEGYEHGFQVIKNTIEYCKEYKISQLSLYAMSRDNYKKRSDLISQLNDLLDEMSLISYPCRIIGDRNNLSSSILNSIKKHEDKYEEFLKRNPFPIINIFFNYDFNYELEDYEKNLFNSSKVNEKNLQNTLLSANLLPIDLLIRTGGYKRLSGFCTPLLNYAEIYFLDSLWGNFSFNHFKEALHFYNSCKKNYGQ
jgi:undecaprenyl diphosphate synthase